MSWPTLTLEAAMASDATSTSPVFNDLSNRLLDFTVQRGRNMELDQTETGTLTAILRNHDRALDPANTASVFYPNVVPVRQARLLANINLVGNPSFETNTTGWNQFGSAPITRVSSQFFDGSWSLEVAASATDTGTYTDLSGLAAGRPYTLTAWVRAASTETVRASMESPAGTFLGVTNTVTGDGSTWLQLTGTFTAGIAGTARMIIVSRSGANTFHLDAVQVESGPTASTFMGAAAAVFRGDIPDWPQDWKARENTVPIQMVDAFDALQIATFTASRPVELSGARVNAILDAIDWPSASRAVDTGQSYIQAIEYETANALQALQDVALAETGVLFMSRTGNITFHNRHRRFLDSSTVLTLSNTPAGSELPLADAKVIYRRERLYTSVFITQNGGATATTEDAAAKARYRRRSLNRTVYLSDPNEVQSMAEYFLSVFKTPVVRVEEVTVEPQTDGRLWTHVLNREIGDRIQVKITPPGSPSSVITSDVTIEGVGHSANGAGQRWQTTFRCSPSSTVDYGVLGTDVLETAIGY